MPRGRRKKFTEESPLLKALRHISTAQSKSGAPETMHCHLAHRWVMASNGIISAACETVEEMNCAPHTYMLIDALERSQEGANVTQLDAERLSVRSGEFQAVIPCLDPQTLPTVYPNAPVVLCDDRLRPALDTVGKVVAEGSKHVISSSIQLRGGAALATDGNVIIEAYHGLSFPPLSLLPKAFVTALGKIDKPIAKLGICAESMTLWFEDNSWLKTQLYPAGIELPDLYQYLNVPSTPIPVPAHLFQVAEKLEPFTKDGWIYLEEGMARATDATEETEFLPIGLAFNIKSLLAIKPFVKTIHFSALPGLTLWFGNNVRGAISNRAPNVL